MSVLRSNTALRWDIRRLGGKLVTVAGGRMWAIFDNEHAEGVGTETRLPVLTCTTQDAETHEIVRKGSQITIDGKVYRTDGHEPDGTGMSRIILRA